MKTIYLLIFLLVTTSTLNAQNDLESVPPEVLLEKAESLMQDGDTETAERYLQIIQQNHADSEYAVKAEELAAQSGQFQQRQRTSESSERPSDERPAPPRQQPRQRTQQYKAPEYCLIIGTQKPGSSEMTVKVEYGQTQEWMDNNMKMIINPNMESQRGHDLHGAEPAFVRLVVENQNAGSQSMFVGSANSKGQVE